jgi:hypothetical protein
MDLFPDNINILGASIFISDARLVIFWCPHRQVIITSIYFSVVNSHFICPGLHTINSFFSSVTVRRKEYKRQSVVTEIPLPPALSFSRDMCHFHLQFSISPISSGVPRSPVFKTESLWPVREAVAFKSVGENREITRGDTLTRSSYPNRI